VIHSVSRLFYTHFPQSPDCGFLPLQLFPFHSLTDYFIYRIYDNGLIVVNGKPKYLSVICIGSIFISAN